VRERRREKERKKERERETTTLSLSLLGCANLAIAGTSDEVLDTDEVGDTGSVGAVDVGTALTSLAIETNIILLELGAMDMTVVLA